MESYETEEPGARDEGPEIYVACLGAYNNGVLHGAWIDANQSPADLYTEVREMLANSPIPHAEEWAIHDYQGFCTLRLDEYEDLDRVSQIAAGIAEHGEAFAAWLSYDSSREPNMEAFLDAYRGEWESLRAYAEDFAESTGLFDLAEGCESAYILVDLDLMTRDFEIDMYTVATGHGTVYVFDPNV